MAEVEYDSAAMREAMSKLRDVYHRLDKDKHKVDDLSKTQQPGGSEHTTEFHKKLQNSITVFQHNHYERMSEVLEALQTLAAIDREYNSGELVNSLNLDSILKNKGQG